uniref:translation elongation factor Ts n=1 Tax=Deinococcus sp. TaxID=47478 RepID=UPI00286E43EC
LVRFVVNGSSAAMVEVNSETDFVARNSDFQALVQQIAEAAMKARTNDAEEFKTFKLDSGDTVGNELAAAAGRIGENLVLNRVAYVEGQNVAGYVHSNGKIGVLVDLAGGDQAQAKDVALHVAAEKPLYLSRDEVNAEDIEKEREVLTNKAINEGKNPELAARIVGGQIGKFYEERVLGEQKFVKDQSLTVNKYLGDTAIKRFVRFEIGG